MRCNNIHRCLAGAAVLAVSFAIGARPAQAVPPNASPGSLFSPPSAPLRLPYDPTDPQQKLWLKWAAAKTQAVHVGMTRAQMIGLLERAGGAYASRETAPLIGVYNLCKCPYFKVSIEFAPVRQPQRDKFGSVWTPEDPKDVITKVSKPYLEQVYSD